MKWFRVLAVFLLLSSITGLLLISLPVPQVTFEIPLLRDHNEQGSLILNQPEFMRLGNEASITLRVEFMPQASTFSSTEKIILRNRLELNSLNVSPKGEGRVWIDAESSVGFKWEINATSAGIFSGTLWLFEEQADGQTALLLARPLTFEVRDFLGMDFTSLRLILGFILVSGVLILIKRSKHAKPRE